MYSVDFQIIGTMPLLMHSDDDERRVIGRCLKAQRKTTQTLPQRKVAV
jgi:hypothetical protein